MQRKALKMKVLALILGLSTLAALVAADARSGGISGRSQTGCGGCHGNNPTPGVTVTISGIPASYTPGNTYPLTVAVSGNPTVGGGFDLSVTAGTLTTSDANARILNSEAVNSNEFARSWSVSWQAPVAGGGTVTFYVAGLATDNDGGTGGDAWNTAIYTSNEAVNQRPVITLTSPTGAQDWTGGTAHMITWTMSDDMTPTAQLKVYLNYTSTPSSGTIAGPLTGATSQSWNVPSIDATDVKVNATVIDSAGLKGYSEALVPKIDSTRPSVLSAQPTGTSVGLSVPLVMVFSETMSRTATQGALSLSPDPGGWTYVWSQTTVPDDTLTANHAPFAAATSYTATLSTTAKDVSDTGNSLAAPYQWSFTTSATNTPPSISISTPTGSEKWTGGTVHNVVFTATDVDEPASSLLVWVNYSLTGGAPFNFQIVGLQGVSGTFSPYAWTLPTVDSTTVVLNSTVLDTAGAKGFAISALFEIDSTRPAVLSAQPTGNSVGLSDSVVMVFSETMSRTATQGALSLSPDPGGWTYVWSQTTVPDDTLTANHAPFAVTTTYTATLSTAAKDASDTGNSLAAPYQWSFTTLTPNTAPSITITAPIGGESWSGGSVHNVEFTASDAEDPSSSLLVWVNYSLTGGAPFGFQIPGLQGVSGTSSPYAWTTPAVDSTTVVLNSTVVDTRGARGYAVSALFEIDSTAPFVTATNPTPGATGVPTNSNILVTWSEPMDATSTESAFSLRDTATWTLVPGAYSWAGDMMTFDPTALLSPTTQYQVNITVLASDDSQPGNNLAAVYLWTFTTAAGADTTKPELRSLNAVPNPQDVFLTVNVSLQVQDNVAVGEVWLNVTDPLGGHTNATMSFDTTSSLYYLEKPYDIVGLHAATVWGSDTSGNWDSIQGTFLIQDRIPPTVTDLTAVPNPVEVLTSTNISAIVSDNYMISGVWVEITAPDLTSTNQSMSPGARYYFFTLANQLGTYVFKVSAKDAGNLWATAISTFISVDTVHPTADAGPDQTPPSNTQVTLDGTGSTDNFGIASYSWSFDDGSGPVTLTGATVQHTFTNVGSFQVTLTVTDFGGNTDTDHAWINVTAAQAPDANAGPDQAINLGDTAHFNGSLSSDDVGITNYSWTLNDNGLVVLWGVTASHTFSQAGDFLVTLAVKDAANLSDTDTLTVHVLAIDSQPPDAPINLAVTPDGPGALSLSWNANTEPDLAGYKVYRSLSSTGPFVSLTPDRLVTTTAYLDEHLEGGHMYYYFVTAVDTLGNESARSNVASGYVDAVTQSQETATDWRWLLAPALAFVTLGMLLFLLLRRGRKDDKESNVLGTEKEDEKGEI